MTDLASCRVLVTPRSYARNDPRLRTELEDQVGDVVYNATGRPLSSSQLLDIIGGFHGYIAGLDEIDGPVIEAADRLKVIARYGVGVDNVDLQAARERSIVVTNTPRANSASVAELTVGLMLSLARDIPAAVHATESGAWPSLRGLTLADKTVGLIGFGAVGQAVAQRLVGFDCCILAYDPHPAARRAEELGVELTSREEVVRRADFLSLHAPLLPETRHLIDAALLSTMKPNGYLVNTARGALVDEPALVDALRTGRLSGAALDVLSELPLGNDHPLLTLPQVIVTPHIAAHTDGATNAMGWGALRDCLAVLRGEEPAHRVA